MTNKDINKLRVEVATDTLKSFLSKVITTQERVMYLTQEKDRISSKKPKERTQQENKVLDEIDANIEAFNESIKDAERHTENFRILIQQYTEGSTVK